MEPARRRQGARDCTRSKPTNGRPTKPPFFFVPLSFGPSVASFLRDLAMPALDSTTPSCQQPFESSSALAFFFSLFFCCVSAVVHFSVRLPSWSRSASGLICRLDLTYFSSALQSPTLGASPSSSGARSDGLCPHLHVQSATSTIQV